MKGFKIAVFVFGLLALLEPSMQVGFRNAKLISLKNIKSPNDYEPTFGLVLTAYSAEKAINESGFFTHDSYFDIYGRRFVIGSIYGSPVVYVRTAGTPSVNVGITVQLMAFAFNLRGVISIGSAGTTNESISLGSVVVPSDIAYTGAWNWLSKDSTETGKLVIGDFNYPEIGENLLGSIEFENMKIYRSGVLESNFWLQADPQWLTYAEKVEINGGDVIVGLKGSSSDIHVNNPAYREFLYKTIGASIVDTSSVATGLAALSNDLKFIAFKGVSNKAGAGAGSESALANANAVKAMASFIWLVVTEY
ncbi:Bark storage protein A [Euphorbia peplus]|nr:Bark storage protein A [Euphorbia peplus]